MTTKQPLALRLADDLTKTVWPEEYAAEAARELRRQHAEIEALREVMEALIHLEHNARASGADMGLALDVAKAARERAGGKT
jgi:hypothetical protein